MLTTENIFDSDDGLLLFLEPARRHACNQRRIRRARRLNTARAASNSELLAIYKSVLNDYLAYAELTDATVLSFVSVEEYIFSWCDDPDDTVCDVLAYLSYTIDSDPPGRTDKNPAADGPTTVTFNSTPVAPAGTAAPVTCNFCDTADTNGPGKLVSVRVSNTRTGSIVITDDGALDAALTATFRHRPT